MAGEPVAPPPKFTMPPSCVPQLPVPPELFGPVIRIDHHRPLRAVSERSPSIEMLQLKPQRGALGSKYCPALATGTVVPACTWNVLLPT